MRYALPVAVAGEISIVGHGTVLYEFPEGAVEPASELEALILDRLVVVGRAAPQEPAPAVAAPAPVDPAPVKKAPAKPTAKKE